MAVILAICSDLRASAENPQAEMAGRVKELIRRGELQKAKKELDLAIRAYPKAAGLYDLLGIVNAQEGDLAAAAAHFKQSINLDPHLLGAYLNLGQVYQQRIGKEKDAARNAIAVYEKLLEIDPRNVEANFQVALIMEQQGEYHSSLAHLDRLPPEALKNPRAALLRLADHAGLGQQAIAESETVSLLIKPGSSLDETDVLAVLPAFDNARTRAIGIRILENLERRGQASSEGLYRLGMLYQESGRLADARSLFERIASTKPSVPVLMQLARIANEQKDYKNALGYLAHARDLAPNDAAIHFFFGMVCVEENLGQEAYVSLEKAVKLEPRNPYYNYALGAVILARDDTHPAIECFQRYCQARPEDPRGRFALGAAYFYSHDLQSAKKNFEAVTKFPLTASGAHYFLGRIANLEGKLDQAATDLELSLRERPGYADALAELGLVRMKQKDFESAAKALEEAIKEDPDNYQANLNLMILYERTRDPRAASQRQRFQALKESRAVNAKQFLRTINIERSMVEGKRY